MRRGGGMIFQSFVNTCLYITNLVYIQILSIYLSICLSVYLTISASIYLSIYLYVYLCIHLQGVPQNMTFNT